jgi:hypothetical protein
VNATYTQNYITSLTQIAGNGLVDVFLEDSTRLKLNPGAQLSRAINMDGYYSLRLFGTYGKPLFKGKLNMNVNGGLNYTQTPSKIKVGNGEERINYAQNPSANVGLVFGTNVKKLDVTIMSTTTLSMVQNTLQMSSDQNYMTQNSQLRLSFNPSSKWVISSDITHQIYQGFTAELNQTFILWNVGLGKKFGVKSQSEIRLSLIDLLNQNRAISRNVTQAYFEDVRSKVLTRYAMITYTYTLRQLGTEAKDGKKENKMMMFPGGMPPPGMHPPGGGF